MMKTLDIEVPIWKWDGVVVVGGNPQDFANFLETNFGIDDFEPEAGTAGYTFLAAGKPWVIWVEENSGVATLVHEAFHAASGILRAVGIEHKLASEEAYAYLLGYIVDRVVKAKKKEWKKVKLID